MDLNKEEAIVRGICHQIEEIVNYRQFYTKEFEDTAIRLLKSLSLVTKDVRENIEQQIKNLAWKYSTTKEQE